MHKPLSESLQKLRRAQRALVRRKRRSRVRVSFTHSTSSRNSGPKAGAAKRASRQLRQDESQKSPVAVPGTPREAIIRGSVKLERDRGPYPIFNRQDACSSPDDGCCPPSPSKRRPPPPRVGLEKSNTQAPVPPSGGDRPYWGTLPKSPIRSPPKAEAQRAPQSAASGYIQTGGLGEKSQTDHSDHITRQPSLKRRPLPPIPGTARYSIFPKSTYPQKTSAMNRQAILIDPAHSESVRRSLSQQRRLSSLVPPEPSTTRTSTAEQRHPVTPLPPSSEAIVSHDITNSLPRSSNQRSTLGKFTRELEKFAIITGAVDKHPVSTPSAAETHISVHTVQELLPYRQQFREAGLAVTSTEQKAPTQNDKGQRLQDSVAGDDRLWLDGESSSAQVSSSTATKESSNDTVIHFRIPDPVSLPPIDELPHKMRRPHRQAGAKLLSEVSHQLKPAPPPGTLGSVGYAAAERRAIRPRPSAILLANKPLPAMPGSYEPPSLKGAQGTSKQGKGARESRSEGHLPQMSNEESPATSESYAPTLPRTVQGYGSKVDKSLPALPVTRASSQAQGIALPNITGFVPSSRQVPTTIEEEREPSTEKQRTPVNKPCVIRHKDDVVVEIQNKEISVIQNAVSASRSSITCKPELPETWKHAIGTPSSFEKALDDVVRKLEDMGENKAVTKTKKERRKSKRTSSKPPSPSQRLHQAAAMRRQRIAEAEIEKLDTSEKPALETVEVPAKNPVRRSESARKAVKFPSTAEDSPTHEDNDIIDRDVLKGLKIICAASADAELDAWIRTKTGLRLRRFLADLKTFETLSRDGMAAVDDQRARRRRVERRRLQAERDSRARSSSMRQI